MFFNKGKSRFSHKNACIINNTGQSFGSYVKKLQKLADYCDFGHLKDSLCKDILIGGVKDNKLKEKMLRDPSMSLSRAIQIGMAYEVSAG